MKAKPAMASFSFPTLTSIDFTNLDLAKLDLAPIDGDAVRDAVKEVGYITVGLAVLATQKAQVRRQELRRSVNDQVGDGRSQVAELLDAVENGLKGLDKGLAAIEAKVDDAMTTLEKRLPERAATLVGQAHEVAKVARTQIRHLLIPVA